MAALKRMSLDGENNMIIGIDLGTTNSAVAVYSSSLVPRLVPVAENEKTTLQSCVRWNGGDSFTVGPEAYAERYESNVCYSVKRLMGTNEKITLRTPEGEVRDFFPAEISAEILKELKRITDQHYSGVTRCIITVPAYFNQRQIEDTILAANLAGLECVRILKEPTSASYIYSKMGYVQDGYVLVYDLGGGTFDITCMSFLSKKNISKKMVSTLKQLYGIDVNSIDGEDDSSLYYCSVLGTYGDTKLGGDDIDLEVAKLAVEANPDNTLSKRGFEELVLRCEQFKKYGAAALDINVENQLFRLTTEMLKQATRKIFRRTMDIVDEIPAEDAERISTIVLVGGSTKNDYLVELLQEVFPNKEISRVLDPDTTVALGAGAVAKDIAEGKQEMYQDVLPLPIGVVEDESRVDICIKRNTALPYSTSKTYYTMYDDQSVVLVDVYQGLSKDPAECTYLGQLRIDDIPPKPKGKCKITVYFLLNAQGRLRITTDVNGISVDRELIIDSIFDVSAQKRKVEAGTLSPMDEFEEATFGLLQEKPEIRELLVQRRQALEQGDSGVVEETEQRILEVL